MDVLDATTLMLTTTEGGPRGQATATRGIGAHLVEDIGRFFRFIVGARKGEGPMIERAEFDEARARLRAAGYVLVPGDPGRVAYLTTDGGTTAPPDGVVRNAALLRVALRPQPANEKS